ncbi:MAG: LPS export ABC transporter periplasmic protein LptC [Rhodobacterales bacterium 17-64-5]|nr:MAG: LPS export ABC transporter periplasmic protein LptC [Rhodobacterales bacterium 17-64-5]
MARRDWHTRRVVWLKVALPLVALAVLSTLFLLADRIDPDDALSTAEVDVAGLAREPRITAPTYAGTTRDGAALTLSAEAAQLETETIPGLVERLTLRLDTPDGATTEVSAGQAQLDPETREVILSGGVVATTSTGYRVATAELVSQLDLSSLRSRARVTATGPAGSLEAGAMTLTQDADDPAAYLLVFNQGVRLVYQPGG